MPKSIFSGHFLNDDSFAKTHALLSFIEHGYVFPDSSDNIIFDMWNMKLALSGLECSYWNCKIIYGISNRTLYPPSFLVTCWSPPTWSIVAVLALITLGLSAMNASGHIQLCIDLRWYGKYKWMSSCERQTGERIDPSPSPISFPSSAHSAGLNPINSFSHMDNIVDSASIAEALAWMSFTDFVKWSQTYCNNTYNKKLVHSHKWRPPYTWCKIKF